MFFKLILTNLVIYGSLDKIQINLSNFLYIQIIKIYRILGINHVNLIKCYLTTMDFLRQNNVITSKHEWQDNEWDMKT
jgi:hypothetical protein